MIVLEPVPIQEDDPNAVSAYNEQLRNLFFAAQNLGLTSRDGAIQDDDKAGNLSAVYVVFTSNAVANTQDTVAHNLGRTPVGYIPVKQDKSAVLYDGTTAFTSSNLYLRSSAATVAWTILVF